MSKKEFKKTIKDNKILWEFENEYWEEYVIYKMLEHNFIAWDETDWESYHLIDEHIAVKEFIFNISESEKINKILTK